jgi:hypothetical protein
MLKRFLFLLFVFCTPIFVHAQIYVEGVGGILPLDLCNCTTGAAVMDQGSAAIAVGNTVNPYYIANSAVFLHDVSTNTSTQVALFELFTLSIRLMGMLSILVICPQVSSCRGICSFLTAFYTVARN